VLFLSDLIRGMFVVLPVAAMHSYDFTLFVQNERSLRYNVAKTHFLAQYLPHATPLVDHPILSKERVRLLIQSPEWKRVRT